MSVFANPFMASHMNLEAYRKLSVVGKQTLLSKGGIIISLGGGWSWPDEIELATAWDAIPAADQKAKIDGGVAVMVTAN